MLCAYGQVVMVVRERQASQGEFVNRIAGPETGSRTHYDESRPRRPLEHFGSYRKTHFLNAAYIRCAEERGPYFKPAGSRAALRRICR